MDKFDTFITVDCADFKRTGKLFESIGQPDINIDHHVTNEKFGRINLIEGEEVATSAILTNYLPVWGFQINKADCRGVIDRHHYRYAGISYIQCDA